MSGGDQSKAHLRKAAPRSRPTPQTLRVREDWWMPEADQEY